MKYLYLVKTKPKFSNDYVGAKYSNIYAIFSEMKMNHYALVHYIVETYNEPYKIFANCIEGTAKIFTENIDIELYNLDYLNRKDFSSLNQKLLNADLIETFFCKEDLTSGKITVVSKLDKDELIESIKKFHKQYLIDINNFELRLAKETIERLTKELNELDI